MVWTEKVRLTLSISTSLVLDRLEKKIDRLQEIEKELTELASIIRQRGGEITEYEEERLTDTINALCAEFENCETCPAEYQCDLGGSRTCEEMLDCKSCPKLRECFREWVRKWC